MEASAPIENGDFHRDDNEQEEAAGQEDDGAGLTNGDTSSTVNMNAGKNTTQDELKASENDNMVEEDPEFAELSNGEVFLGDRLSSLHDHLEKELSELRVTHLKEYDRMAKMTALVTSTQSMCAEYEMRMGVMLRRVAQVRDTMGDIRATVERKIEKEGLSSWLRSPEAHVNGESFWREGCEYSWCCWVILGCEYPCSYFL